MRAPILELGALIAQLRATSLDARKVNRRIDLRQQIPASTRAPTSTCSFISCRNLGADVDIVARLQRAAGSHHIFYRPDVRPRRSSTLRRHDQARTNMHCRQCDDYDQCGKPQTSHGYHSRMEQDSVTLRQRRHREQSALHRFTLRRNVRSRWPAGSCASPALAGALIGKIDMSTIPPPRSETILAHAIAEKSVNCLTDPRTPARYDSPIHKGSLTDG